MRWTCVCESFFLFNKIIIKIKSSPPPNPNQTEASCPLPASWQAGGWWYNIKPIRLFAIPSPALCRQFGVCKCPVNQQSCRFLRLARWQPGQGEGAWAGMGWSALRSFKRYFILCLETHFLSLTWCTEDEFKCYLYARTRGCEACW